MTTDISVYFDEDFLENPDQDIKINGIYYKTENVQDPKLWAKIVTRFKNYNVQPMNLDSDSDIEFMHDEEDDDLEVYLMRIVETGKLFTVSNVYDEESDLLLTFH